MCKIVLFTNFRKIENNAETINFIANKLLETERDGFGYSIQGKKGFYGEKYIGKNVEFETSVGLNKPKGNFYQLPFVQKTRDVFGEPSKANGGALFHGRISTNKGGLKNTHPINKNGWSLIHNGVVTNHGPEYEMQTDNDTEHVVQNLSTGGIDAVAANLTGYYAVGAFDPQGNMHIIRDDTAWLYCAKIEELETYLFATTPKLIEKICEQFAWERSTIELVKSNSYMIFNSKGELTSFKRFESRGYGYTESSFMSKSLSYMGSDMPFKEHYENPSEVQTGLGPSDDEPEHIDMTNARLSDYEAYRTEVDNAMDRSYSIFDYGGRPLKLEDFKALETALQDECTIVRPDGTLCTPEDYYTDRLAENWMFTSGRDIY